MSINQYIQISLEDAKSLIDGGEVQVCIGKKIKRLLTTKSVYEIKKADIDVKYEAKIKKLKSKNL